MWDKWETKTENHSKELEKKAVGFVLAIKNKALSENISLDVLTTSFIWKYIRDLIPNNIKYKITDESGKIIQMYSAPGSLITKYLDYSGQ